MTSITPELLVAPTLTTYTTSGSNSIQPQYLTTTEGGGVTTYTTNTYETPGTVTYTTSTAGASAGGFFGEPGTDVYGTSSIGGGAETVTTVTTTPAVNTGQTVTKTVETVQVVEPVSTKNTMYDNSYAYGGSDYYQPVYTEAAASESWYSKYFSSQNLLYTCCACLGSLLLLGALLGGILWMIFKHRQKKKLKLKNLVNAKVVPRTTTIIAEKEVKYVNETGVNQPQLATFETSLEASKGDPNAPEFSRFFQKVKPSQIGIKNNDKIEVIDSNTAVVASGTSAVLIPGGSQTSATIVLPTINNRQVISKSASFNIPAVAPIILPANTGLTGYSQKKGSYIQVGEKEIFVPATISVSDNYKQATNVITAQPIIEKKGDVNLEFVSRVNPDGSMQVFRRLKGKSADHGKL